MNDIFCRLGLKPYTTTCVILFHQEPGPDLLARHKEAGFDIVKLPENPYIEEKP